MNLDVHILKNHGSSISKIKKHTYDKLMVITNKIQFIKETSCVPGKHFLNCIYTGSRPVIKISKSLNSFASV